MIDLIPNLLPMMLGTALAPIWIILVLLILRSRNGLLKAIAFVAGITLVRLMQGFVFGYVLAARAVDGEAGKPSSVVSTLLMIVGILLLIAAIKSLYHEPDPDAPPPKWMGLIDSATPLKAFGLGAIFTLLGAKLWVFTLSAISVIRSANLNSPSEYVIAFLIYVLGAQSVIILPLVISAIIPRQSASLLAAATDWLNQYNRLITIIVSSIFGLFFFWNGLTGLLV